MPLLLVHRRMAVVLGALSSPLAAQAGGAAPVTDLHVTAAPIVSPAASSATRSPRSWALHGQSVSGGPSWTGLTVVELPPENGMANGRRHHAISIPFHSARQAARRLGIDATECAVQLRMPTRMAREPVAGARSTFQVQAQVRLACRM